jgi:hypothetical protein
MAAHSGVRSCHAALTGGGTADTFDLTADGFDRIEIFHHGNVDEVVYYRTDGTTAVASADETRSLGPGERQTQQVAAGGAFPVISIVAATGAPKISVEGF